LYCDNINQRFYIHILLIMQDQAQNQRGSKIWPHPTNPSGNLLYVLADFNKFYPKYHCPSEKSWFQAWRRVYSDDMCRYQRNQTVVIPMKIHPIYIELLFQCTIMIKPSITLKAVHATTITNSKDKMKSNVPLPIMQCFSILK
jgi:hypothetical protein